MPIYTYRDDETGFEKEVLHSMKEMDTPSEETLKEITYQGRLMHRVPGSFSVTNLPMHGGGKIDPVKAAKVRAMAKETSKTHYKKEIEGMKKEINKNLIKSIKGN